MKKVMIILTCIITISLSGISTQAQNIDINKGGTANVLITPKADNIIWKYKIENGKMYKRKYNKTQMKWVGDWILC